MPECIYTKPATCSKRLKVHFAVTGHIIFPEAL